MSVTTGAYSEKFYFGRDEARRCPKHTLKLGSHVGHLGGCHKPQVVLYVKIDWLLPNGAQNIRFLAGLLVRLLLRGEPCKNETLRAPNLMHFKR